eukprot:GILJ01029291.1.p1 GENE.GILJ01029291.1~~GILJ01029291.1.p1  ORF type:complete len:368 (-),score=49.98 GILJ01029291.1:40-1143(-)
MYTICTPTALREAYYQWDKAGAQQGMTANRTGAPLGQAATSQAMASIPSAPWTAVELDATDCSVVRKEFTVPFHHTDKNKEAKNGGAAVPVSATIAASISFPSLKASDESSQTAPPSAVAADEEAIAAEEAKWHYRYRFNKRGRCVIETNHHEEGYWQGRFGTIGGARTEEGGPAIQVGATVDTTKGIQREIVVFFKGAGSSGSATTPPEPNASAVDIGAVDLNCYHIGYPIDMGDIEDIAVCGVGQEDEGGASGSITTINCPLHNRIFDVASGDLIRMDYSNAFADCLLEDPTDTLFKVTKGKWKGGVVQRDKCRQRIHTVTVDEASGRLVINDSYFGRDAPGAPQYVSDKYNALGDTSVVGSKRA